MDSSITATFMPVRVVTSVLRSIAYHSAERIVFNDPNIKLLMV